MLKIIFTIAVIYAVYIFLIKKPAISQKRQSHEDNYKNRPKEDEDIMVECEKCGTFVSSDEAIIKDGKYYCSKKCAGLK